jgi:hypothetical protein
MLLPAGLPQLQRRALQRPTFGGGAAPDVSSGHGQDASAQGASSPFQLLLQKQIADAEAWVELQLILNQHGASMAPPLLSAVAMRAARMI